MFVITAGGIVGGYSSYRFFDQANRERLLVEMKRETDLISISIQRRFGALIDSLYSINAFFKASDMVTRKDFAIFTAPMLARYPEIRALEWIPYVRRNERKRYIELAHQDGLSDFEFTDRDENGSLIVAEERDEYFPVFYAEPLEENKTALGHAPLLKARVDAIEKSIREKIPVSTARVYLVQDEKKSYSIGIFLAAFKESDSAPPVETRETLMGLSLGLFNITQGVERTLDVMGFSGINFLLADITDPANKGYLYFNDAAIEDSSDQALTRYSEEIVSTYVSGTSRFSVADRMWEITAYRKVASGRFQNLNRFLSSGLFLLTVCFIDILLFFTLRNMRRMEFLVRRRTEELDTAHALLTMEYEKTEASLREKEVLLREVHHRVKNNMQIISSLLNLQLGTTDDENLKHIVMKNQNRILAMSLVHEMLYQSEDISRIHAEDFLVSLVTKIISSYGTEYGKPELMSECEAVYITINQAMSVGLLVNELVNNSLKYAFIGMEHSCIPCIWIKLSKEDHTLHLMVKDNGNGFSLDAHKEEEHALGLQLVYALADQLQGRIEYTNSPGAEWNLYFPYE